MPNQQLIEYIKQARASGKSDIDIKSALLGAGWKEADVDKFFFTSTQTPKKIGKFKASRLIARASWNILKQDKEIMIFPILSAAVNFFIIISVAVIFLFLVKPKFADNRWWSYLVFFALYLVTFFVTIFFQTGVITIVHGRFNGQNLSFRDGLRNALNHSKRIFLWSLISATVGVILNLLFERSKLLGRVIIWTLGSAWGVLTFFIVPVLIIENLTVKDCLKKSALIMKKTWGETVIIDIGVGLYFVFLAVLGLVLFIVSLIVFKFNLMMLIVGALLLAMFWISLIIISSSLNMIFKVALYEFATTGKITNEFPAEILQNALKSK